MLHLTASSLEKLLLLALLVAISEAATREDKEPSCQSVEVQAWSYGGSNVDDVWSDWSKWNDRSKWSNWGRWSERTLAREEVKRSRHRDGNSFALPPGDRFSDRSPKETERCLSRHCPIDDIWSDWSKWNDRSKWSNWGRWSERTVARGDVRRSRHRDGNSFALPPGDRFSDGSSEETERCVSRNCPIVGVWSDFSDWSKWNDWSKWSNWGKWSERTVARCKVNRSRRLDSNSFALPQGGRFRDGSAEETDRCISRNCPIDGVWSDWSKWNKWNDWSKWNNWGRWSERTVARGKISRSRRRDNDSSALPQEGRFSDDSTEETEKCISINCPIDGVWSDCSNWSKWNDWSKWSSWGRWSERTVARGEVSRSRRRHSHSFALPQGGGFSDGSPEETERCDSINCPIVDVWSDWSAWSKWNDRSKWSNWGRWSERTVARGEISKSRRRDNDSSALPQEVRFSDGNVEETERCVSKNCPIDGFWSKWNARGKWSNWGKWSEPTVARGKVRRSRRLDSNSFALPQRSHFSDGSAEETERCVSRNCPIDSVWSDWSKWNDWSQWSNWGRWSESIVIGGEVSRSRHRDSDSSALPQGGRFSDGSTEETERCISRHCPIDDVWTDWSKWNKCNDWSKWSNWGRWRERTVARGEVSRSRRRDNDSSAPPPGGRFSDGNVEETERCVSRNCPIDVVWSKWNDWSKWSERTMARGEVTRSRRRSNDSFALPQGSRFSDGSVKETERCISRNCPIHGVWSNWNDWIKWSNWGGWSERTVARGEISRSRRRDGDSFALLDGSQSETTKQQQKISCNGSIACSPVNGSWSEWSQWGDCTGLHSMTRERSWGNPYPAHKGSMIQRSQYQSQLLKDDAAILALMNTASSILIEQY